MITDLDVKIMNLMTKHFPGHAYVVIAVPLSGSGAPSSKLYTDCTEIDDAVDIMQMGMNAMRNAGAGHFTTSPDTPA